MFRLGPDPSVPVERGQGRRTEGTVGNRDIDHLRLQAENFGAIAAADVELRPLTVFVGPSGSGKSYFAKLIYTLHRYFSQHLAFESRSRKMTHFYKLWNEMSDRTVLAEQLADHLADTDIVDIPCPPEVARLAREAVKGVDTGTALGWEMGRVYGVETLEPLILNTHASARIALGHNPAGHAGKLPFRYAFDLQGARLKWHLDVEDDAPIRLERSGTFWRRGLLPNFFHRRSPETSIDGGLINPVAVQHVLADLAQPSTVGPLARVARFLPASRLGGMEAQQFLLRGSLDLTTAGRRRAARAAPLSGVLVDYIEDILIDLSVNPTDWEAGEQLAREIEQAILKGEVRVEPTENGPPQVLFRPDGWEKDLPLVQASSTVASMVADIVPVVLYLRHHAQPGETLIIEEPEAHMHPAMQVRFAAGLARMVAAGIRVIVTVHSDWILSALANICRMAKLAEADRSDLMGGDVTLPANQVGVWEFVPDGTNGAHTREIILDSDNGMYDAGYPRVAETLYNDWAEIHSRLQDD